MHRARAIVVLSLGGLVLALGAWTFGRRADARRAASAESQPLRVCADPNNLPFSNRSRSGFENEIASLIARDLGTTVEYTWWPQRRGFVRNTLNTGACDVVMGVPAGYELLSATTPYYRSTYVFVTRRDRDLHIASLDDSTLRRSRIGVHVMGDDYANSPAAQSLARRGMVRNVVGYTIYGDYSKPDPPAELVHAVALGDIDVAVVWGPLAGYFAARESVPLALQAVTPAIDPPAARYTFAIAMGVRRGDSVRRALLERELAHRSREISTILARYGVPLLSLDSSRVVSRVVSRGR